MTTTTAPYLNSQLFHVIKKIEQSDSDYWFIQPLGACMILQCVDGTPLAAIHVNYVEHGHTNKATLLQENEDSFRILLNTPNKSIQFYLTNLTDYRKVEDTNKRWKGMININLMPSREKAIGVNEVNPGGYNQVNEICPFESSIVEGNQISEPYKNARFIIQETFQTKGSNKKVPITVQEDEAKEAKAQQGSFTIWPTVHAQKGCEVLTKKFELGTRWVTVRDLPWFYIKSAKHPQQVMSSTSTIRNGVVCDFSGGETTHEVLHIPRGRGFQSYESMHAFGSDIHLQSNSGNTRAFSFGSSSGNSFSATSTFSSYEGNLQSAIGSKRNREETEIEEQNYEEDDGISEDSEDSEEEIVVPRRKYTKLLSATTQMKNKSPSASKASDAELIQTSHITTLVNGESVNVRTLETNADYEFKLSAPIVKLSFTIQSKLEFMNSNFRYTCNQELQKSFDEVIQIDQQGKYKEFIEKEKLTEKNKDANCYICTEANPNVMFCCCGHIGTHDECIKGHKVEFCGLCRTIITAKLIV